RLGEAPKPLIATILELHQGHVDGALMMRDHHPCKVAVGIAAWCNHHTIMHAGVGAPHLAVGGRLRHIRPIPAYRTIACVRGISIKALTNLVGQAGSGDEGCQSYPCQTRANHYRQQLDTFAHATQRSRYRSATVLDQVLSTRAPLAAMF